MGEHNGEVGTAAHEAELTDEDDLGSLIRVREQEQLTNAAASSTPDTRSMNINSTARSAHTRHVCTLLSTARAARHGIHSHADAYGGHVFAVWTLYSTRIVLVGVPLLARRRSSGSVGGRRRKASAGAKVAEARTVKSRSSGQEGLDLVKMLAAVGRPHDVQRLRRGRVVGEHVVRESLHGAIGLPGDVHRQLGGAARRQREEHGLRGVVDPVHAQLVLGRRRKALAFPPLEQDADALVQECPVCQRRGDRPASGHQAL
jgi:hypothetical protein